MIYPRLIVQHNHGALVLANATIDEDGTARGTIVGGGTTSRLFHASITRKAPVGEPGNWPLYGREPRPQFTTSAYTRNGFEESPTPGVFAVDCCFCG